MSRWFQIFSTTWRTISLFCSRWSAPSAGLLLMPGRDEPADGHYDVVVIGSGIGGTSAAAQLAHAGAKVLVVERLDGPGGLAHSFKRGGYTIDPAIHTIFDMAMFD